jgi:hypothetical protein
VLHHDCCSSFVSTVKLFQTNSKIPTCGKLQMLQAWAQSI